MARRVEVGRVEMSRPCSTISRRSEGGGEDGGGGLVCEGAVDADSRDGLESEYRRRRRSKGAGSKEIGSDGVKRIRSISSSTAPVERGLVGGICGLPTYGRLSLSIPVEACSDVEV
jgi:hypothetical protein